jgi:hypothetical protein
MVVARALSGTAILERHDGGFGSKGGILDACQLLPLAPNQQTISELCRTSFDG